MPLGVTCPNCEARLELLRRLGLDASALWRVGNRDGQWRGCAAYMSPAGRVVLCVARPVEKTWTDLLALAPTRRTP
jgi:hypothetical protein